MLLGRQDAMKGLKAAQGAGEGLRAACCLTLLSETRRKSPGKRPAGGQRTCCLAANGAMKGLKAAQGAGEGLTAAYCLTLLLKPEENLQESARQVAKGHAARPPRAS